MRQPKVLVVDIDPVIRSGICNFLTDQGFRVAEAANCSDAQLELLTFRPDALLLDWYLPNGDVPQLLSQAKSVRPKVPVLLLAGQVGRAAGTWAVPHGADEVLTKPVAMPELHTVLMRMLKAPSASRVLEPAMPSATGHALNPFIGRSPAILRLRETAARILSSESPVLIQGETGTGKGVLAKWIHRNGARAQRPFLDLNCAGLPRELLESELFGHQKGAFTSATSSKQGLLEVAEGGTVFLDEIGDMDLQVQSKLLKVLEERVFRRLGEVRDRAVDMRLISATHRDLPQLVAEQRFRSDLLFRVNIVWLSLPPLRERMEDIAPLSERLLHHLGKQAGRGGRMQISVPAMRALEQHSWPGNIRELRNVLERALLLAESDVLHAEHLELRADNSAAFGAEKNHGTLKQMERAYIHHVLQSERGSVERAARRLGIPRSSLYNKMRRFAIAQGTGRQGSELLAGAAD